MGARADLTLCGLLVVVVAATASGAVAPAGSYPDGVELIEHSDIVPESDFMVQVILEEHHGYDRIQLFVCQYHEVGDDEPEICYLPVDAAGHARWFEADTSNMRHPVWEEGTELGYKVGLRVGEEVHYAPADTDYYRVVLAWPEEPIILPAATDDTVEASLAMWAPLAVLLVCLARRARRIAPEP